jgi:hypothetical protein
VEISAREEENIPFHIQILGNKIEAIVFHNKLSKIELFKKKTNER